MLGLPAFREGVWPGRTATVDVPAGTARVLARPVATRLAWGAWSLSLLLMLSGLALLAASGSTAPRGNGGDALMDVVFLMFGAVGALIAARQPENAVGWLLCALGLLQALGFNGFGYGYVHFALFGRGGLPGGVWVAWLTEWLNQAGFLVGALVFLLFPTGRPPSRRWRWVGWCAVVAVAVSGLAAAVQPGPLPVFPTIDNPLVLPSWLAWAAGGCNAAAIGLSALSFAGGVGALLVRLRRSGGMERQQVKWVACAAVLVVALLGASALFPVSPSANVVLRAVLNVLWLLIVSSLPLSIGVAILRYRLYDVDLLISRAIVYGALTAGIVAVNVLVVGVLGAGFRSVGNLVVAVMATGLVAVIFQPLRARLQAGVNRLVYGERDTPYAVLSRLGRRLEETLASDDVLPAICRTVSEALRLPYVAIVLSAEGGPVTAAADGLPTADPLRLPLVYGQEVVGELLVAPRSPGEGFAAADRRLLDDLARQAGVAARAVRLTADVQHSRERLVLAREEERRRLRRDLHDGLGPMLGSLTLKLGVAEDLIEQDPAAVRALLANLKAQTQTAVADIRRLVYALRPPALDHLGLVAAVREEASSCDDDGLRVSVVGPESLPPLPAAVEVAAYRIVQEALTNVVRHAGARCCAVSFALDRAAGELRLEIGDDGRGLQGARGGVGLASMRERAEELGGTWAVTAGAGGGTVVRACLPYRSFAGDGESAAGSVGQEV